jgi:hypothetical protein
MIELLPSLVSSSLVVMGKSGLVLLFRLSHDFTDSIGGRRSRRWSGLLRGRELTRRFFLRAFDGGLRRLRCNNRGSGWSCLDGWCLGRSFLRHRMVCRLTRANSHKPAG